MGQAVHQVLPRACCSILENSSLSRHFATQEYELSEIDDVSFERLATLFRQCVECGVEDVALVEVRSVITGVSTIHA
jgi:hypothetical protein